MLISLLKCNGSTCLYQCNVFTMLYHFILCFAFTAVALLQSPHGAALTTLENGSFCFPATLQIQKEWRPGRLDFPTRPGKQRKKDTRTFFFLPQHFCRFPMVALCINYSFWIWFSISHSSYCTYAVLLVKGITATYLLQSECMHMHGKQFEWVKRQRMHIIISSLPYRDGDPRRTSPASGLSGGSWTPMHQASARLKRNIKKYMKLVI